MESIWTQSTGFKKYEPLSKDIQTEAVVIGGGITGLLIAYFLQQREIETVLLESSRICSGQTRNTTAKITSQHNLIYNNLIQMVGKEKASHYAQANEWAIREYELLIQNNMISCEFSRCPSYLYSCVGEDRLKSELEAALSLGIEAKFTTNTELPFPIKGALKFESQAKFHPLKFLQQLIPELTIYERTPVLEVKADQVITKRGIVTAKHIIFACHYPFPIIPGYYFARMWQERSYVIALEQASDLTGLYLGIDQDGHSFRTHKNILLLGGEKHRTGKHSSKKAYEKLRQTAKELWSDCREISHWSAQDCMTLDGIPYIGHFSQNRANWYVATGFGKWGMTSSMISARILTDRIVGITNPYSELFSPQRHMTLKAVKSLFSNGISAVQGLSKRIFSGAKVEASGLKEGCGGIIEWNGEKVGAFRKKGKLYVVSIRCPHMGCQLEWNPDEQSWDCPCHGSRFDYHGHILDNPAQTDLLLPH